MVNGFWQDLGHAARMFVKNPGFASVVIVSIAIGVGANTAMFSLADGLLLRPLPVPDASGVVSVVGAPPTSGFGRPQGLSHADYQDVRARARSFDSLVAYRQIVTSFAAHSAEPAERTLGVLSTSNLFSAMGIQPALGRLFFADDDVAPGQNPVVVL